VCVCVCVCDFFLWVVLDYVGITDLFSRSLALSVRCVLTGLLLLLPISTGVVSSRSWFSPLLTVLPRWCAVALDELKAQLDSMTAERDSLQQEVNPVLLSLMAHALCLVCVCVSDCVYERG
jgi:hypothetical protein